MKLIDAEELYNKTAELESQALEIVRELNEQEGGEIPSLEWIRWTAILGERSAFKYDIMDAPTIDAVPVVRCKDCKYYEGHYCWRQMKTYLACVFDMDYCSSGEKK